MEKALSDSELGSLWYDMLWLEWRVGELENELEKA